MKYTTGVEIWWLTASQNACIPSCKTDLCHQQSSVEFCLSLAGSIASFVIHRGWTCSVHADNLFITCRVCHRIRISTGSLQTIAYKTSYVVCSSTVDNNDCKYLTYHIYCCIEFGTLFKSTWRRVVVNCGIRYSFSVNKHMFIMRPST